MQTAYITKQFTYILIDGEVIVNRGTDQQHTRDGFYLLQQRPEVYIPEWDDTLEEEEVEAGWIIKDDMYIAFFQYTDNDTWLGVQLVEKFDDLESAAMWLVNCAETREIYYNMDTNEVEFKMITG
jgi:hypothetical protein